MKSLVFYICILIAVHIPCFGEAGEEPLELDLRKENTFRWIYESGFRPRRSIGEDNCAVLFKNVRLILPKGDSLMIPAREVDFYVPRMEEGVSSIEFSMLNRNVDDARKIYQIFSKAIGPASEDFESFAAENLAGKRGFVGGVWGNMKSGLMSISWHIRPSGPVPSVDAFRPEIVIHWPASSTPSSGNRPGLKPPPGFEQFPMLPIVWAGAPKQPPDFLRGPVLYKPASPKSKNETNVPDKLKGK